MPPSSRFSRAGWRIALALILLALFAGLGIPLLKRPAPVATPSLPPPPPAPAVPQAAKVEPEQIDPELERLLPGFRERLAAINNDGRRLDPNTVVDASLSTPHPMQLALDEVVALKPDGLLASIRIEGPSSREELEKEINRQRAAGQAAFPVFYVKDAPRVSGTRRVVTGELVAALRPGVTPEEIARDFRIGYRQPSDEKAFVHYVAPAPLAALELRRRMEADPRIAFVDHDLIAAVERKAALPNDTFFSRQWHLLNEPPLGGDTIPNFDIGLFPPGIRSPQGETKPVGVWGDLDVTEPGMPLAGIRGRNVRVGVVDDGIDFSHQDLSNRLAPFGQQHSYEMEINQQQPNEPPRIVSGSGLTADHLDQPIENQSHGTSLAALIAASTNNSRGVAGVAPEAQLIAIRALSYIKDASGSYLPVPTALHEPQRSNKIAPMADVLFAAAYQYLYNENDQFLFPGRTLYPGTADETRLTSFADSASGPAIPIKQCGWGAPDVGIYTGPGPEVAGVFGQVSRPGARWEAILRGRNGLGTIIVHAAGNGRNAIVENVNADGWANARGVITVGSVVLPRTVHASITTGDHVATYSEWGPALTVVAPGGGFYFVNKNNRIRDSRPQFGTVTSTPRLTTADWSIERPPNPTADPPHPELFGLNKGGTDGDLQDDDYTQFFAGTSASSAIVSGVIALMLEANPRLGVLDVQNILLRTARNHIDYESYLQNPSNPNPPGVVGGVDPADRQDVVAIDRDWVKNAADLWFNHKYGAGMVHAARAVDRARLIPLLPPLADHVTAQAFVTQEIRPDAGKRLNVDLTLTPGADANFVITHVTLHFDRINTPVAGSLFITVTSPSGMESVMVEPFFNAADNLKNWTFTTLRNWGEPGRVGGSGNWKVHIEGSENTIINPLKDEEGRDANYRMTLTLHGFNRPAVPSITAPLSTDPNNPTRRTAIRGRAFTYGLTAEGNPTVWYVNTDATRLPESQLPPGLRFQELLPTSLNTYLPSYAIEGNPTVTGTYRLAIQAANAGGVSQTHYLELVVEDPPPDCHREWASLYFGPNAHQNPAARGDADPDNDGYINSLEFALGMNPTQPDAQNAFTFGANDEKKWQLTYRRYVDRGFATVRNTYEVQVSSDLVTWTTVAKSGPQAGPTTATHADYTVSEGEKVTGGEPCGDFVNVTVAQTGHTPPNYFRIKVTPYRNPLNP